MASLFVTGTGTAVGKTVVACALAHGLKTSGSSVAVFKPVVTGLAEAGASGADHERLRSAAGSAQSDGEIAPYRYDQPASPHLAAERLGDSIDPGRLLDGARRARLAAEHLICEGVGGLMVPLGPDYLVRDFARDLALPVVIVAPPGLGTINHTLLTVAAARAAGLEVALIVLTPWPDRPGPIEESNAATIERLAAVRVELLPELDLDDPDSWPNLTALLPPQGRHGPRPQ